MNANTDERGEERQMRERTEEEKLPDTPSPTENTEHKAERRVDKIKREIKGTNLTNTVFRNNKTRHTRTDRV